MNISVIGVGYVGLVTALGFAAKGHNVSAVELRPDVVKKIASGKATIYEPGLEELLAGALKSGKFSITTDLEKAVLGTDLTFICVGTPSEVDGSISLAAISKASAQIGVALKGKRSYHVVVVKSTVLPGTSRSIVAKAVAEASGKKPGKDFGIAMNPEFLREGKAVDDFMNPDRIVIGAGDERAEKSVRSVYEGFSSQVIGTSLETAEMIKYTNNSFFALCISFANEIASICETVDGVDAIDVMRALWSDGRITTYGGSKPTVPSFTSYLIPGCGFGGSCFPKDLSAISHFAKAQGEQPLMIDATIRTNHAQAVRSVAKATKVLGSLEGKTVAVLGLAFKPDTDDIRESPALRIVPLLLKSKAKVRAFDPNSAATASASVVLGNEVKYCPTWQDAIAGADLAIIVTAWKQFKNIQSNEFVALMKQPNVLDCRRLLDREKFAKAVRYYAVGVSER